MNSIYRPCRPCLTTSNNIKTQRAQRRKGTYLPYLNTSNHTSAPWTLNSVLRIIIPLHYKTLLLNNVDKTRSIIRLFQNKNPAAENIAVFWYFRKYLCFSVICLPPLLHTQNLLHIQSRFFTTGVPLRRNGHSVITRRPTRRTATTIQTPSNDYPVAKQRQNHRFSKSGPQPCVSQSVSRCFFYFDEK